MTNVFSDESRLTPVALWLMEFERKHKAGETAHWLLCSCRRAGLGSQHPHGSSQTSVSPFPGDQNPSYDFSCTYIKLIFNYLFVCLSMGILLVYMSVHYVCAVSPEARKGHRTP